MNDIVPHIGTASLKTVTKALRVLKAYGDQAEWGVTELARHLDMSKSITHRLIATLVAEGFLTRGPAGTYQLGSELIALARSSAARTTLSVVARPRMERLAKRAESVVTLAVLRGHRCVFLDIVDLGAHVRSVVQLGDTLVLNAGAGGRAILAFQSPEFIDAVLDEPIVRYTDRSPTDSADIIQLLDEVRRRGWAYSAGEVTPGTATVAAPIRNGDGHVVASVNITTTSARLSGTRKDELSRLVVEAATAISKDLGHLPPGS